MKIEFIKNIQFSRLIKINGVLKEFNFRKPNRKDSPFTVDVIDERANRIIFYMQKTDETWNILPQTLPVWIQQYETTFAGVIDEELKNIE
jgi:hypothetical protein